MKNQSAISLIDSVSSVLTGKRDAAELAVISLLAGGHLLLEDVPGVGKTTLSLAIAAASGCTFGRIQFTPDTMPSDVFGVSIYDSASGEFRYKPGVIMKNIILADEINRTPPKTQSALLEAMEEHQVTVDGVSYAVPEPFFVVATQNPVEHTGTYPLPEAQLDRFMMRISIGYPDRADEESMIAKAVAGEGKSSAHTVMDPETLMQLQKEVKLVTVCPEIISYIVSLVSATRESEDLVLGASPRSALALTSASQAAAYISGRDYVTPDDVKRVWEPVMTHRVAASAKARAAGHDAKWVISRIKSSTRVPML